jgi:CheY-like chemotaxis protein
MEKVLIVNDCRLERKVMEDQLLNLGYDARSTDEYGCLQQLDDYCPDIVIANLTMNETTGDKLIAIIKGKRPQMKCFISSCSAIKLEDYTAQNVDAVFQTPVNLVELEQVLND